MGEPLRVFVIGQNGMLGHVVMRYLSERGFSISTSDARYSADPRDPLIEAVRESEAQYVVNCLGRVKQKTSDRDDLYRANAIFPIQLASRLRSDQYLLHASSDCVFSGREGGYSSDGERDAADVYGVSKLLGEMVANAGTATVLRVSIVGPQLVGQTGLLSWFLGQPIDHPVAGFTNHLWNGVTTLAWAKLVEQCVNDRERGGQLSPLMQIGSPVVTKFELLCAFRQVFGTQHVIEPVEAPDRIDRSLLPDHQCSPIEVQLEELCRWYGPFPRDRAIGVPADAADRPTA